ncbi:hypothetical protein JRQ81_015653 [Phrynocephalus forsythii]|uniref:Uncharacterized protein n=1 Tax=Phrynocephalus forsythii TaxID=171643 RepID=A0A9Q1B2C2_9SAUR|nr:hypothetical protein JRQ81_015653 [Phrynocephalus forsythii]
MTQIGQHPRQFLHSRYENLIAAAEDEIHIRSATVPDTPEQMETNISAVTQVGRQLAIIGDEYNKAYDGKLEGPLFHLVKGMAASIFQACFWNRFKSAMETPENFYSSGWRKIIDCLWIVCVPLKYLCQKWVPATLLTILMWWLLTYGLQN